MKAGGSQRFMIRAAAVVVAVASVLFVMSIAMGRWKRAAEIRSLGIYASEGKPQWQSLARAEFGKLALEDYINHIKTAGPLAEAQISSCVSQVSGRPVVCTIKASRRGHLYLETWYWYDQLCLRFESRPFR